MIAVTLDMCAVQTTSDGKGPASATFVLPPLYLEPDTVQGQHHACARPEQLLKH